MTIELAQIIIEDFEENPSVPTSIEDWKNDAEIIMMYLAALKYMEAYYG